MDHTETAPTARPVTRATACETRGHRNTAAIAVRDEPYATGPRVSHIRMCDENPNWDREETNPMDAYVERWHSTCRSDYCEFAPPGWSCYEYIEAMTQADEELGERCA